MRAVEGNDKVIFVRKLKDKNEGKDGIMIPYQTEHEISRSKDSEITQTKSGPVTTVSGGEDEVTLTSLVEQPDSTTIIPLWEEMEEWYDNNEEVELWEANRNWKDEKGNYKAKYHRGFFTEFSMTAPADGKAELSLTYGINGIGQKGFSELTEGQIEAIQYVFEPIVNPGVQSEQE